METKNSETLKNNNAGKEGGNKCTVKIRTVTIDEIKGLLAQQKSMVITNNRDKDQSAFEKTLKGSKEYLKHNGLIQ